MILSTMSILFVWSNCIGNPSLIPRPWKTAKFSCLTFSPDGRMIAAAIDDLAGNKRGLGIWDVATRQPIVLKQEPGGEWYEKLVFSPGQKALLAVYHVEEENRIEIWDLASRQRSKVVQYKRRFKPGLVHADPTREFLFPKGAILLHDVLAGQVIDISNGNSIRDYDGQFPKRFFNVFGDGLVLTEKRVKIGGLDFWVRDQAYDVTTGKLFDRQIGPAGRIWGGMQFCAGGQVRSLFHNGGLVIWHGQRKVSLKFDSERRVSDTFHSSPDGRWLAVGFRYSDDEDKSCMELYHQQIYDLRTGKAVGAPLVGWDIAFSPDGTIAATLRTDRSAIVLHKLSP